MRFTPWLRPSMPRVTGALVRDVQQHRIEYCLEARQDARTPRLVIHCCFPRGKPLHQSTDALASCVALARDRRGRT